MLQVTREEELQTSARNYFEVESYGENPSARCCIGNWLRYRSSWQGTGVHCKNGSDVIFPKIRIRYAQSRLEGLKNVEL